MRRSDGREPVGSTARHSAGHVMCGGVAEAARRLAHWVPIGAEMVPYRYGVAYRAVCGAACVVASEDYLEVLPPCRVCSEREPGFVRRLRQACCSR
ncbi:hypothetical protein SAMN05421810_104104 [Amycolatopsis arida]|uniref:Uncharacterized protein n=1 Tax=Amycolatopsis arida TaxID=587909 RepID=A0A1I5UT56_9PSEU|nr:hypothetical protein [Amycolatopsis arida]TDX91024.1 hypothetical protein CLV69_106103 [Amycolatopsis arida]SFP98382.1 hypothetical protein SAMN05421810_104104 [Amycolatopsis arida]